MSDERIERGSPAPGPPPPAVDVPEVERERDPRDRDLVCVCGHYRHWDLEEDGVTGCLERHRCGCYQYRPADTDPPQLPESDDTNMTPAEFRATKAEGIPVRVVTSRAEYEEAMHGWCPECDGQSTCAPGTCPGVGAPEAAREMHVALDDLQGLAHRLGFCCYAAALDPNSPCPWHASPPVPDTDHPDPRAEAARRLRAAGDAAAKLRWFSAAAHWREQAEWVEADGPNEELVALAIARALLGGTDA